MKKYFLALLFIPTFSWATDTNNLTVTGRVITERMDVSTLGKTVQIGFIDGSSQTTAGFIRIKDEGVYVMGSSTLNFVGPGITATDAGNGVTQIQVTATGGGTGASSLSVGKGSIQKYIEVSSPTSHISVSTNGLNATLISPTTVFFSVDYSTWDATYLKVVDWNVDKTTRISGSQSLPLAGNSSNYIWVSDSLQPNSTFYVSSGTVRGPLIAVSSINAQGVISTTAGFVSAGSSFLNQLQVPPGTTGSPSIRFVASGNGFIGNGTSNGIFTTNGSNNLIQFDNNITMLLSGQFLAKETGTIPQFSFAARPGHGVGMNNNIFDLLFTISDRELMRFDNGLQSVIFGGVDRTGAGVTISTITSNALILQISSGAANRRFWVDGTSTTANGNLYVVGGATVSGTFLSFGSMTAHGVVVSTVGFIAPSSSFTTLSLNGVWYKWPSADGSPNQVLKTDGSQNLSWTTITGGSGGGATSLAIFDGSQFVSIATAAFPGATISFDGATGSSITFIPAIRSTWTAFITFASTAQAVGISTQNIQSFLAAFMSTSDARGNTFVNFRSTTDAALSAIRSTAAFVYTYTSTADARGDTFVNFRSTSDSALSVIRSTAAFLFTYTSTADARGNTFVNFRSTSDNLFDTINSTIGRVITSTAAFESRYNLHNSTTDAVIAGLSAGSGHTIQDEGTPLTARANLNFVGAGVTATDDAGNNATVVTINATGGGAVAVSTYTHRLQWSGFALVGISSDLAPTVSTTAVGNGGAAQNPHLVASFSEATTDYRRAYFVVPSNIAISSTVNIGFVVRASSAASGKAVQLLMRSSGTMDGQVYNMVISTGIDVAFLPGTSGQQQTYNVTVPVQTGTGALGWSPNMSVYFDVSRGHDTSKLTSLDLPARLSLLSFYIDLPILVGSP